MKAARITVRLGDKEYGNELMAQAARQAIADNPGYDLLVVTVNEHGGWRLSYVQLDGKLVVCGTANDSAVFPDDVKRIQETIWNTPSDQWTYLPSVIR